MLEGLCASPGLALLGVELQPPALRSLAPQPGLNQALPTPTGPQALLWHNWPQGGPKEHTSRMPRSGFKPWGHRSLRSRAHRPQGMLALVAQTSHGGVGGSHRANTDLGPLVPRIRRDQNNPTHRQERPVGSRWVSQGGGRMLRELAGARGCWGQRGHAPWAGHVSGSEKAAEQDHTRACAASHGQPQAVS